MTLERPPRLWLVTDRAFARGADLVEVVGECLRTGLPAVQIREKDLSAAELAGLCRRVRALTRASGACLAVNDRVDVALAVGADAVQRTSTSLPIEDIRAIAGPALRIGASVHSLEEADAAEAAGADWLVFGPVYDTPSKRRYGAPQGATRLAELTRRVRTPVVAIGGVTVARVPEVLDAGACAVAVISAILDTPSPAAATAAFVDALGKAGA